MSSRSPFSYREIPDRKPAFIDGIQGKGVLHSAGTVLSSRDRLKFIDRHQFHGCNAQFPEVTCLLRGSGKSARLGSDALIKHRKAADMKGVDDSLSRSPCGCALISRQSVIGPVEKAARADCPSFALDLHDTPAAGIYKESAAAEKPVVPFGGIQRIYLNRIQTSESVFISKLNRDLTIVRAVVKNKSARFLSAEYSGDDHAVLRHGYARIHAVRRFYLNILVQFRPPCGLMV